MLSMRFTAKTEEKPGMGAEICSAIESKQIIKFYYRGGFRTVEPFCYGVTGIGSEVLTCYQVGGYSELDDPIGWKLYRVAEMSGLTVVDEQFAGARSGYNPNDPGMATVYRHVGADAEAKMETAAVSSPVEVKKNSEVEPKKSVRLFTSSYIRMIKLARKLNQNKKISGDIYFHPTEKRVMVKSIDLGLPAPFNEVNSRHGARISEADRELREKRWLEAYLIKQAKNNDWKLKLVDKEYVFLLSQLRFGRGRKGEKQGKTLDLLLYDDERHYLLALGLKGQVDASVLYAARSELRDYVARLEELVAAGFIARAFDSREVMGIDAYLVCPKTALSHDLGKYGLIEYEKIENPWQRYREIGSDLEIRFTSKKYALNLLWQKLFGR